MMKNTTLTTEKVIDKIEQFCDVLRTNYQSSCIERHRQYIEKGENVEYTYVKGKKYAKIVHLSGPAKQRSAHAFVDLNTGDVYKSASWQSPAKGVRYNLMDEKSCEEMYKRADWAGGYLYK
jgi:hypothetical protein